MADEDRIMLEITGLKKKFGEDVILDGVDLTINKGEVVVMLGSSGCGKSTLLRCINGLESFDKGSIRIDGEEIVSGSKALPRLRQKIGMVFQSYDLFPHRNIRNYSVTLRNPQFLHKVEKWEGSEKNQRNVNIQEEKKVVC